MSTYLILSIVVGLVALGVAVMLSNAISAANAGTARMKEIAGYIHEGAMAFLYREYKYLAIFIVVVAAIIATFLSVSTALCFIGGAVFSICAGYLGMNVATKANVRTAEAARHGMSEALKIAFSGGAVMGLGVVGLGIAGLAVAYFVFDRNIDIVTGFGLGASSIALFARVGGGIYTKAADVGADLVGKVEAGIPEDDPRNPATIADNVGDNVGDVAGMGADLFESYVGAIISALTLGAVAYPGGEGVEFVFMLAVAGILASIIGVMFARSSKSQNPQAALNSGTYIGGAIVIAAAAYLSNSLFGSLDAFWAIAAGLLVGMNDGATTEIYTFYGACHYLMNRLIERFPGKAIFIMTPIHRVTEDNMKGDGYKAYNVAPLKTYVEIIREVAEYYSLPVLDLYAVSGIQPKVDIIRERYCPDGLHPNDAGHVLLTEKILAFLKAM